MLATADYLIDYHNAWTGSISFSFRDRVLYQADQEAEQNRAEAEALAAKQEEMLQAYGHTIVTEFPGEKGVDKNLHRSTSGSTLLVGKIPSFLRAARARGRKGGPGKEGFYNLLKDMYSSM